MDCQRSAGRTPGVEPKDLHIQMAGSSSAVVSFHLGTAAARRTLVYRREAGGWRIVHLHGSSLKSEQP
jgi:ketosteroid isomerase-like protein